VGHLAGADARSSASNCLAQDLMKTRKQRSLTNQQFAPEKNVFWDMLEDVLMFFNDVFFLLEMVSFNLGAVWFWGEIILPNLLQFFEARCAPQRGTHPN